MSGDSTETLARRLVQADEPAWNGQPLGPEMGLLNFLNGLHPSAGWSLKRLFNEDGSAAPALQDLGRILERALKGEPAR